MDLTLTPDQASFQDEVRTWLRAHVPTERLASPGTPEGLEQHRSWERTMFEAGLAAVHWPREHGGRGLGPVETSIFYDEYLAAGAPDRLNRLALGLQAMVDGNVISASRKDRVLQGLSPEA